MTESITDRVNKRLNPYAVVANQLGGHFFCPLSSSITERIPSTQRSQKSQPPLYVNIVQNINPAKIMVTFAAHPLLK